jgi:hypothetical protein
MIVSLGTQISNKPSRRKIGGTTIIISIRLVDDVSIDFSPISGW